MIPFSPKPKSEWFIKIDVLHFLLFLFCLNEKVDAPYFLLLNYFADILTPKFRDQHKLVALCDVGY